MIEKIGVIYQDANSLGLLKGLKARLGCSAALIPQPAPVGRSTTMTQKQARIACAHFRKMGVDLIVRFTDADDHRWQHVRADELSKLQRFASTNVVCGVAVRNTEHWLAQMGFAGELPTSQIQNEDLTGWIKAAITREKLPDEDTSDTVARLVLAANALKFRQTFRDHAFTTFYADCRVEATRADCPTRNEQQS